MRRPGYHVVVSVSGSRRYGRTLIGFATSVLVGTGCMATSPPLIINPTYHAQAAVARVTGAEKVRVYVVPKDLREYQDWICAQFSSRVDDPTRVTGRFNSASPPAGLVSRAI